MINKSFLSDDELFCTAVNVLISKWKLQSLSACYVSRISSLLCPHRLCPTCVTCLQVCAVFSAGSVYCCLFSWNICAVHSVGCRLLSLAQVFAFDHHLVTFPPELGTPIRSLLQSVVLCTGAAAAGALLCKNTTHDVPLGDRTLLGETIATCWPDLHKGCPLLSGVASDSQLIIAMRTECRWILEI